MSSYYFVGQSSQGASGNFSGNVVIGGTLSGQKYLINNPAAGTVVLTTAQSGQVWAAANGGNTFTIPAATGSGIFYTFVGKPTSTVGVTLQANAADRIVISTQSTVAGNQSCASAVGTAVTIFDAVAGMWRAYSFSGTWTAA